VAGAGFDLVVGVEQAKRNALRRIYGSGDLHFVTFSCYRRRPYLGTVCARNRFVKILDEVHSRHGFALIGYELLPEHVHLLIGKSGPDEMD
jgi:putative transposase